MTRIIGLVNRDEAGPAPQKTVEFHEGTPEERARNVARSESFWRNTQRLSESWDQLLPAARGKFVAVADLEIFVAQTRQEALDWIQANHPNDLGAYIDYVSPREVLRTRAY